MPKSFDKSVKEIVKLAKTQAEDTSPEGQVNSVLGGVTQASNWWEDINADRTITQDELVEALQTLNDRYTNEQNVTQLREAGQIQAQATVAPDTQGQIQAQANQLQLPTYEHLEEIDQRARNTEAERRQSEVRLCDK